jgi:beta-galactosidase
MEPNSMFLRIKSKVNGTLPVQMNKVSLLAATIALSLVQTPGRAITSSPRQHILLDSGWLFQLDTMRHASKDLSIVNWRTRPATAGDEPVPVDASGAGWSDVRSGTDMFHGRIGFAWFVANLPSGANANDVAHFESVDDNAVVFLNGVRLVRHSGWDDPFDVPLKAAWKAGTTNVLTVLVENTDGGGGIMEPVTVSPRIGLNQLDLSGPWRKVHLPHDYVVEGTFTPNGDTSHGSLPKPTAWYRRQLTIPAGDCGKSISLEFEGVYRDAMVYLNGRLLGRHESGYTPFRFDISKLAKFGRPNQLAVHVDPRHNEGWFYEGGGIYRHVWLNVESPTHIAQFGTYVRSSVKNVLTKPSATLSIKTTIDNSRPGAQLISTVIDPNGRQVAQVVSPLAGSTINQTATVKSARLWSLEKPKLYRLHSEIRQSGRVIDAVDTPFGIRTIRFDAAKGFFLNEKPVKIKGTCNHQDFAGLGSALPDTMEYWRVRKLKGMGSNAWRMSHNPPNAEVLDACDRLGMLVMDENRHLGDTFSPKSGRGTPYSDMSELDSMILRDRNHPSVIMWSMCNEEPLQNTDEGAAIFAAMRKRVLQLDPTRPVTIAMNSTSDKGIAAIEDIVGFNYNVWGYDRYHHDHPSVPLYGSETSSEVSTRGVYATNKFESDGRPFEGVPAQGYVSEYGGNVPGWATSTEEAWSSLAGRPFMAGGFVWTGFDYKGEPTPFGWPDINSNFGIMDEAGFPKDRYYYYQSVWGDKPVVHVFPHWNWRGHEGKPIDVWVYSNASRVELLLNGKSLGAKDMPKWGHLEWSVPYAPGALVARGYSGGKLIATDRVETTGAPVALRLRADRTAMAADGEDVIPVEVDVVDAKGRVVPTAGARVTFAVRGAGYVAGVGNGDPSDHDPDKASYRRAFAGKCLVDVGAGDHAGGIVLTATSPGLKAASMTFTAR